VFDVTCLRRTTVPRPGTGDRCRLALSADERQNVWIDNIGMCCHHAVGEAGIDFQRAVLQELRRGQSRAQLHLKTIRAAGQISFKGYGRGAAEMTSGDAAGLAVKRRARSSLLKAQKTAGFGVPSFAEMARHGR
jgi:hypothetical protein